MATFTRLDDADARAIAAAAGLGAVHAVTPIPAGTVNSNFAFACARGRFFVRVNEGKTAADVAWEADLVVALAAAGLPTPSPLPIVDAAPPPADLSSPARPSVDAAQAPRRYLVHRGLLVSVFPWIEGRPRAAAAVTAADAATIGRTLGALHRLGLARGPATWRAGFYRFPDLVDRFRGFAASTDPALAEAIAVLAPELALQADAAPVRAAAAHGLIHGDLFRDNVLWDGPTLTAVLDFEQASAGGLVYDVAVALHDWCWSADPDEPLPAASPSPHGAFRPALAAALVAAHREVVPWTAADHAALAIELRAAAARFTITRITDVHLRQVDNPDKDFRAFLARLAFWRSPAAAAALAALAPALTR